VDVEPEWTCVLCRGGGDGRVCRGCRRWLGRCVAELPGLLAQAVELTVPAGPAGVVTDWTPQGWQVRAGWSALPVPAGPTSVASRLRISGSRPRPVPVSLELLNIVGPGATAVSDPFADQYGELPVAVWMRGVADDWAALRGWAHLTASHVTEVGWLARRLSAWLDWACDHHPAIESFAEELSLHRSILRHAAGVVPPEPEHCHGVACQRCNLWTLWRHDGRVECGSCHRILDAEDYDAHVKALARAV